MFKQHWQPEMITQHILARSGKEQLNSHYYATTYPDVYAAAGRVFGSWKETIEAAGLNYSKIRKYKSWTRHAVLEAIRKAYAKGKPINSKAMQDHNKPLYMAAIRRFGNWGNAIKAIDINYGSVRVRRAMTKAEIKREILTLYRQKVNLSYTNMRENYQYLLAAGMKKLGDGSWARAREECGILTNYRLHPEKRGEKACQVSIAC
jgi:hypothetical protein